MARYLQLARITVAAGIGLQLNGQLTVGVQQPAMTRFEVSAALAAVEREQELIDE
jgi:hypothetical protein